MSRCIATNNYIYDHVKREKSLITYIGASSCRFYGRAFRRNHAYVCDRECVRGGSRRNGEKKIIVIAIPTILFTEFLSFHRASECVCGTHIPATSPLAISRREDTTVAGHESTSCKQRIGRIDRRTRFAKIALKVITIKCEQFTCDD